VAAVRARDQHSLRGHDTPSVRADGAHRLGDIKHYAATDHLDSPSYQSLTPDDLLDVVAERELGWDAESETGVVLHMVSALAVAGRIGLTAIGDTLGNARGVYYGVKAAVDEAATAV